MSTTDHIKFLHAASIASRAVDAERFAEPRLSQALDAEIEQLLDRTDLLIAGLDPWNAPGSPYQ